MTSESKGDFIVNPVEIPFMIIAKCANDKLIKTASSVVHVDNTARPQTVKKDVLPKWHHLLKCVEEKCGIPVVLNTSFNVRNEPVDCTPSEAIRCFYSTGLDALVMEDIIISK